MNLEYVYLHKFDLDCFEELSIRLIKDYQLKYGSRVNFDTKIFFSECSDNLSLTSKSYSLFIEFSSIHEDYLMKGKIERELEIQVVLKSECMNISPNERNIILKSNKEDYIVDFDVTPKTTLEEKDSYSIYALFYYGTELLGSININVSTICFAIEKIPITGGDQTNMPIVEATLGFSPSRQPPVLNLNFIKDNSKVMGTIILDNDLYKNVFPLSFGPKMILRSLNCKF